MRGVLLVSVLTMGFIPLAYAAEVEAFLPFSGETEALSDAIQCPRPATTVTPGLPDLWGCILAPNEVTKVFVNADEMGATANVKVMWNDYTKDIGYGLHTDKAVAQAWLAAVVARYAAASVGEALAAFEGNADVTIENDRFQLSYTFWHGPAIDERLVTITAK